MLRGFSQQQGPGRVASMAGSPRRTIDDPRLLPFLPYIYLAWSDGELAPGEIEAICSEMDTAAGIATDCKNAFSDWLDLSDPPTPTELHGLLQHIRVIATDIADAQNLDIDEFVSKLALLARNGTALTEAELSTVRTLGARLGLIGREPTRALIGGAATAAWQPPGKRPFDDAIMAQIRDGDRADIRRRVRALLTDPAFAHAHGLDMEAARTRTLGLVQRLADEGLGRLGAPADYGGVGTPGDFLGAFSALAHHDLSVLTKFGVQFGLFGGSIVRLGTERHHAEYLPRVLTLELPGCFAMTETDHGSNVRALETTATYDPSDETFIIHTPHPRARKDYIGNAARDGRLAVVFAQLVTQSETHGVHALVVPIRDQGGKPMPGVHIEDDGHKAGHNGVDNGRLGFGAVRVPRTALLNRFADVAPDGTYSSSIPSEGRRFFTTIGTLVGGRIGVATTAISAAETALTIAIRYGSRRRQFGPDDGAERLLLDYPSHQRRLMPPLATAYAYRFALEHLIDDYAEERIPQRELEGHAAGLKAYASWHGVRTIQECREACGGAGYLSENRLGLLHADADVFQTYEGDNTVLAQLVARGLLSNYAQQFNDMSLLGTIRFMAARAIETVREANPIVLGGSDPDELLDRDRYRDLFRWRQDHLIAALAARLKKRIDDGMESADAFAQVQTHAIAVARAHVEHLVLERFVEKIDALDESPERDALDTLCDLYALSHLESDRGWFQEHGQLSAAAAKALRKVVANLCREVRVMALPLVDAFAIPDEVLGAPIAT
jgi:acyl-CoA oxidase